MRGLATLLLCTYLSSCITYTTHASDPEPGRQATFLAVEVGVGLATGLGLARKKPERPMWQHLALGVVTAFALDGAIALFVWQVDKKSE
jgi:hypothetical protein